jgi:hypothetical protein
MQAYVLFAGTMIDDCSGCGDAGADALVARDVLVCLRERLVNV